MSAFMCDDEHLSALARYAARKKVVGCGDGVDPVEYAFALLRDANVLSLQARYPKDWEIMVSPMPALTQTRDDIPAIRVIKSVHCYQYQACEHDGWEGSPAHKLTERILRAAVQSLPGYEDAAWGSPLAR